MLTWRCFKSSLLQLHSARRISKRIACQTRSRSASFLPLFTALFFFLALLFHFPSYTLKSPSPSLSWKPVYYHTHASRISSYEQFFYMQITFFEISCFLRVTMYRDYHVSVWLHRFFSYKFKVNFSWKI